MLRSYLSQREAWTILDGIEVLVDHASEDEAKRFAMKNALARDALLRGVLVKNATKISMLSSARTSRKKADNTSEDTKVMQVKAKQQISGGKRRRPWKQNNTGNGKKKFNGKTGDSVETRTCYFCKCQVI
ncbi:hypothetical protein PHMEG_00014413 [Phytophthora megakarya]|uniref:Uncharacterized protein n=1 Tax=Phytophthora megakarya TaxID=4795 RepID=A0A225W5I0_9STRA|nr:hypothetical protein PHMEG_00014413 [Phytophthora megakarya]